jgi:hypothetical protein
MHELRQRNCLISTPTQEKLVATAWFAHWARKETPMSKTSPRLAAAYGIA